MSSKTRAEINEKLGELFGIPALSISTQMNQWLKETCPEEGCQSCKKILGDLPSYSNYSPLEDP